MEAEGYVLDFLKTGVRDLKGLQAARAACAEKFAELRKRAHRLVMKIGLLYEPAYWFLLEDLVRELEHEIGLVDGQSYRLTTATLDQTDVDLVYVLPYDAQEKLEQLEAERLVINSVRAQETTIDKIADLSAYHRKQPADT